MKKKNSNLKLCADSELQKDAQRVKKGAFIITIAITAFLIIVVGIIAFFC